MKIEVKLTDENGNVSTHRVDGLTSEYAIQDAAYEFQQNSKSKMAIERIAFAEGATWLKNQLLKK